MGNPTNKTCHEPIREPANDQINDQTTNQQTTQLLEQDTLLPGNHPSKRVLFRVSMMVGKCILKIMVKVDTSPSLTSSNKRQNVT
jgi:hypothetical protein